MARGCAKFQSPPALRKGGQSERQTDWRETCAHAKSGFCCGEGRAPARRRRRYPKCHQSSPELLAHLSEFHPRISPAALLGMRDGRGKDVGRGRAKVRECVLRLRREPSNSKKTSAKWVGCSCPSSLRGLPHPVVHILHGVHGVLRLPIA